MERFELSLLGGRVERRYRELRPDVETLPWGTLPRNERAAKSWTIGSLLEHRAAAAAAETVRELVLARAPVDLVSTATRFPLDELVHAELSARMAMELGGAADLRYEPESLLGELPADLPPLDRAARLVVKWFCVAESFSLPLVHAQRDAATHPLARGVFEILVRDDSHHARFGWDVLDWAIEERALDVTPLAAIATEAASLCVVDLDPHAPSSPDADLCALGLIDPAEYSRVAKRALHERVLNPLRERGIACECPAGWQASER